MEVVSTLPNADIFIEMCVILCECRLSHEIANVQMGLVRRQLGIW